MNAELIQNSKLFLPELVLLGTLILLFLIDALFPKSRLNRVPLYLILTGCVLAAVATCKVGKWTGGTPTLIFSGLLSVDLFANFFRYLFLFAIAVGAYIAFGSKELKPQSRMEFSLLLLCVGFGLSLMALSANLLMLYIGIETVSIVSFVMAGFSREDSKSNEASFKYLVFGGLASGLMIYGFSLIYGITGSLSYGAIATFLSQNAAQIPLSLNLAVLLMFCGLAYKISAFPMHAWTPDVYEGSPTPVATFFSVGPKAAGFAALLRIVYQMFSLKTANGWTLIEGTPIIAGLAIVSAATMIVGNLSAIGQRSTKRLLAYSSIAHVGYLLMGLVSFSQIGLSSILFYLVVYCAMNLGAFWVVCLVHNEKNNDELDAFRGLGWSNPLLGVCMGIFLFSLTGIPLFAGFIGKFLLFTALLQNPGFAWLAVLGVLNSVVSLYYYSKILKAMWLDKPKAENQGPMAVSLYHVVGLILLAIPTIVLGLYFTPVLHFAERSLF